MSKENRCLECDRVITTNALFCTQCLHDRADEGFADREDEYDGEDEDDDVRCYQCTNCQHEQKKGNECKLCGNATDPVYF